MNAANVPGDPVGSGIAEGLRAFFDAIDEGFCVCEMIVDGDGGDGEAVDYRFLDTNPLFEEMTGLVDAVGRTALELVPDLERHWIDAYARVGIGGETLRFQQGSEAMGRHFDVYASPLDPPGRFAIVFKDVTAQTLAEREFRETGARFRALLDELPMIVWVHDAVGAQEFVNSTFCDYFGVTREEMLGDRWQMLVEPISGARYAEEFARAVAEQRYFHSEVLVQDGRGEWRLIESYASPRFDAAGAFVGHVGTSVDITEARSVLKAEREARLRSEILERTAVDLAAASSVREAAAAVIDGVGLAGIVPAAVNVERLGHLRVVAVSGVDDEAVAEYGVVPVDADNPVAIAFRECVTVTYHTAEDYDRRFPDLAELRRQTGAQCTVVVPVVDPGGGCIATLAVSSSEPHWFTPDRIALLEVIALQAGAAFERVIRHEHDRKARERASFIAAALTKLEQLSTVDEQLACLARLLVPDVVDFATIEDPTGPEKLLVVEHHDPAKRHDLAQLRQRFALGVDDSNSLARVAAGAPQLIPEMTDPIADEHIVSEEARRLFDRVGVRSHLAVPLPLGDAGRTGALLVGITDPERDLLDADDLSFFEGLSRSIGPVVASAATRERDHEWSVRLQRSLLPTAVVETAQVDIVAHYRAGTHGLEVGGDWYDTFTWPDGHTALTVGDIVGHDIDAAIAMGQLRVVAQTLINAATPDPQQIIDIIDTCSQQHNPAGFLTAICAVIDPSTTRLHYLSAGHPPGLIVRNGEIIWLDAATRGPICSLSIGPCAPATVELCPDDLIVLYSDGLIEHRGRTLQDGFDNLERTLSDLDSYELEHVSHQILEAMGTNAEDDVVLLAARYAATSPTHTQHVNPDTAALEPFRNQLRDWLVGNGQTTAAVNAVLLAANEAVTNAIEHSGCQNIVARAALNPRTAAIEVSINDDGTWRTPRTYPANRGRGVHIMQRTASTLQHVTDPTGTTTLLTFAAPSEPAPVEPAQAQPSDVDAPSR